MTLNGVISIILRYFAEFDSFRGHLRLINCWYVDCLPINVIKYTNKHDPRAVLFALAELLVKILCAIFLGKQHQLCSKTRPM